MQDEATFGSMGVTYQEKLGSALFTDHMFAEQMMDVFKPNFFELKYLELAADKFYEHKRKYHVYPSLELLEIMIKNDSVIQPLDAEQASKFLKSVIDNPLNGDKGFIEDSALDFCRKQNIKAAMLVAIDQLEAHRYDEISSTMKEALNKGASFDMGKDYMDSVNERSQCSARQPISTGWPVLDKTFNGGWERKTLVTFIAPTGAGKSMFLVNCGASAVAQGLNVVYVTCEMADYKIGLRFDSYFSGIEINNVPGKQEAVQAVLNEKVKGRLFIKEFPTKTATVQTIRSYLQRLEATKSFRPDVVIIDYADLLRGARGYGDKRFELESIYEDLRALAQEFNVVLITADQTNRSGLDQEVVTLSQIAESYAKATVCDVIMTVSRKADDKMTNSGRLFVAKSRLGQDGMVYPFFMNTATVKATILEQGVDPIAVFLENNQNLKEKMADRFDKFKTGRANSAS